MKDTNNYCFYNIPRNWQSVVSSDILDIRDGTHETPKYVLENGIPLITSKNLKNGEIDFTKTNLISHDDHVEISKRSGVEKGDILFAMIGTIGNPVIVKENNNFSIKNVGLFKKNNEIIISQFIYYFLISKVFERQLHDRKLLKGTTQKFIPLGNLRNIIFPLPPLAEQHRIVAKIEELFSSLDNGIQNLKTAQQQLKIYRQAVLKWAFDGKLTRPKNDISQSQETNDLPEGWQWVKLGQITSKIGSGSTPQGGKTNYKIEGIPLVRSLNIHFDRIKFNDLAFIDEQQAKKLDNVIINENDVLLNITGASIGRVNIAPKEFHGGRVNQHVSIIRVNENYLSKFIKYFIQSPNIQSWINNENYGVTRQALTKTMIENLEVPAISLNEQTQIVAEIESRLSVCEKLEETIQTSLKQAETLRQSILKKAFSGQLVPQDPNDEPASLLLQKIQTERTKNNPKSPRKPRKK